MYCPLLRDAQLFYIYTMSRISSRLAGLALLLLVALISPSAVAGCKCSSTQYCSRGKCVPKKQPLARCDSAAECLSGICFKKACRQVRRGQENIIIRRTDIAWKKYKYSFKAQEVQVGCPPPSATQTGIVEKIVVDEVKCCYKPPGTKKCINMGSFVETLSLQCWGINPSTTEPRAGVAGQSGSGRVCKKGAQFFPTKSRRPTKTTETGWQGKNAGFTEVWVTGLESEILGGWPYKACRFPPGDCRRTLPPSGSPTVLTCPRGTSLAGLVLVRLSSGAGDIFVGIDGIVCQDPLGWLS